MTGAPRTWGAGPAVRCVLASLLSAALAAATFAAGRSVLPLPEGWGTRSWVRWWQAAGPLVAVFSLSRVMLVVLGAGMALGFATLSVLVCGTPPAHRADRMAAARTWPAFGPVVRVLIGLGASGGSLAACGTGTGGSGPAPPPALTLTNPGPAPGPVHLPGSAPAALPPRAAPLPPGAPASPMPSPTSRAAPAPTSWVVRPGDSLWSIAEATVGSPPGRVASYWAALVALNRPALPDPADPSLIFPGEVIRLPPLRDRGA